MRPSYRTVAAAAALLAGCDNGHVERIQIVAHYVPACAPDVGDTPSQLELIALGDFDRSNDSVSILPSNAALRPLSLPDGTQAAELTTLGDRGYWGQGALNAHNEISIPLWPRNLACPIGSLEEPGDSTVVPRTWLLAASARQGRVVALDVSRWQEETAPAGLAFDLGSALSTTLAPGHGQVSARTGASLSELGERFIVAGGLDPISKRPLLSADSFSPDAQDLDVVALPLASARANHAALSLASGATLLIGGRDEEGRALASVEILSPDGARGSSVLELLSTPRIEPRALLLDETRILVGGGYDVRDAGDVNAREAIASVELLNLDLAARTELPIELEPAAFDRAFVALSPGNALALGGCGPPEDSPDCLSCNDGNGCVSRDVWWIDARGNAYPLEPLPLVLASATPYLVAAAQGAAWLIADGRLGRFDPWLGRFELASGFALGPLTELASAPLGVSPGLFVWSHPTRAGLELSALYHSQRGAFTQDVAPLLLGTPDGVVPERPPTSAVPSSGDVVLTYRTATGLTLAGGSAAVSVADTDYADFTLELTLASGPPPLLKLVGPAAALDTGTSLGGLDCPWPELSAPASESSAGALRLRVQRTGDRVRLEELSVEEPSSSRPEPCERSLPRRVRIALIGTPAGTTRLTRVEVRRAVE